MASALRVLVVEGDPLARAGLEYFLQKEGFQTRGAATLNEALTSLDHIDAAFLELALADGNGANLLKEIRTRALPIRVAIMTAKPQSVTAADTAGCDAYFEKPITRDKLETMLAWLKTLPPNASAP